jgi:AcrR family transcriptional regulator
MPTKRFDNLDRDRKSAIISSARSEFAASGFERASLNTIAREADISKGSLYYYFEDKLDLYMTVLTLLMDEMMEAVGGFMKGEITGDFWEAMFDMYDHALRYMYEHPDIIGFGREVRHLVSSGVMHSAFADYSRESYNIILNIMLRGQEMGAVRKDVPIDLLVHAVYYMDEGMDIWMLGHWEELSEDERKRFIRLYVDFAKDIAGTRT